MDYIEEFNNSCERIGQQVGVKTGKGQTFFGYFYRRFIESSPEVAHAFRNTDMNIQKKMLKQSLFFAASFVTCKENFDFMERIAKKHSRRELNITPALYDLWLGCMVAAVAKFDPLYNDDVELAWRLALAPAIAYMKCMYDK